MISNPPSPVPVPAGTGRPAAPALSHALALQPLPTGALIDRVFLLYRRHFLQLVLFGALVNSLPFVLGLTGALALEGLDAHAFFRQPLRMSVLTGCVGAGYLVSLLFMALMQAALTRHAADLYLGRETGIGRAVGALRGRWLAVLWTDVLKTLVLAPLFALTVVPIVVGLAARAVFTFWLGMLMPLISLVLLVPGLILLVRWLLTTQTVMLEGESGWRAITRSSRLIRYDPRKGFFYWGETRLSLLLLVVLAATMLLSVVSTLPMFLAQLPKMLSGQFSLNALAVSPLVITMSQVLEFLGRSLITPLYVLAGTLFYYDIRCRREGLDIVLLSDALRGEPPVEAVPAEEVAP